MSQKNRGTSGDVSRDYCRKYADIPDLTLARMLHKDEPVLFPTVERARSAVRYARAKKESGCGRKTPDPVPTIAPNTRAAFAYRAPASHAEPLTDVVIHGAQRILRLSDIHYPFHDERALSAAIEYGMKHDPTVVLLDGDVIDCHDLSDYDRDPRHRYTEDELRTIGAELDQFRRAFPKARILWKSGNHEDRLKRYLMRRAPDLYGLPGMDVPGLVAMTCGAGALDRVEWIERKRVIRCGHLAFLHGHEFGGCGGGVNPARWLFLRAGENAICGHFHRTSEHSEPSLSREQRGAWSTGCLCDMSPDYMPHNKWNHGFAWIEVEQAGTFRVKNIRIIDGKIR